MTPKLFGKFRIVTLEIFLICLSTPAIFSNAEKVRYDGYSVYRVIPKTAEEVEILLGLVEKEGVSFWLGPSRIGRPSDILLSPQGQNQLLSPLRASNLEINEFIPNIQALIDAQDETDRLKESASPGQFQLDKYHRYNEIESFLRAQVEAHKDIASLNVIGQTFEGRNLTVVKIATAEPGETKPIIWIDANIHAGEWITGAVATYVIHEFLNGQSPIIKSWLKDFDFYFLPIHNPDGLEYSHTTNRLWRKTRSDFGKNPFGCRGADPNRNWGFKWVVGGGSSTNPCSDMYAGASEFSELETAAASKFQKSLGSQLRAALTIHSYSQLILVPYGVNVTFPKYQEYMRIGKRVASVLQKRYGTVFTPGNIVDLLYAASGGNIDWFEAELGSSIVYSAAFELRDTGKYGFLLPAEQIIPSSLEFLDGLGAIIDEVRKKVFLV